MSPIPHTTKMTDPDRDRILDELWQQIEDADNSCSEPPAFIAGMRYAFDVVQPLLCRLPKTGPCRFSDQSLHQQRDPRIAASLEPPASDIPIDADFFRGMRFMLDRAHERIAVTHPAAECCRTDARRRAGVATMPPPEPAG
jgi:hypothetical protein